MTSQPPVPREKKSSPAPKPTATKPSAPKKPASKKPAPRATASSAKSSAQKTPTGAKVQQAKPTSEVEAKSAASKSVVAKPAAKPMTKRPVTNKPLTNKPLAGKTVKNTPLTNDVATGKPVTKKPMAKPFVTKPATTQPFVKPTEKTPAAAGVATSHTAPAPSPQPTPRPQPVPPPSSSDHASAPSAPAPVPWATKHADTLRRLIPAFVLVPVLGATAVLLVLNGASVDTPESAGAGSASVAVSDPAVVAEASAAAEAWLRTNVTRDQRLIVDESMSGELTAAGWNPTNVIAYDEVGVYSLVSNEWRDANYVVTTPSAATTASPDLSQAVTNSIVVASFGAGPDEVQIRMITPSGKLLASLDASDAAAERVELGTELSANPAVQMSVADRELVTAGRIDSRVIIVLGALAGRGDVAVTGFPRLTGEPGQPIRQVALGSMNGVGLVENGQLSADARELVASLSGDFTPSSAVVSGTSLVLRYPVALDPLVD